MSRFVCPNCNYQTTKNEQFCCKCGTMMRPVTGHAYCRNCGRALNPEDQFCGQCGTSVKSRFWQIFFMIFCLIAGAALSFALNSCMRNMILNQTGSAS